MIGDDEQVESKIDANTSALFLTLTAESSGFCKTFESFNASKKGSSVPLRNIPCHPLRAAKVLQNLLDGHLFLKGTGNTRQEAISSILDQVSLWPFVVPGTESENLPYQIPSFFGVLQDKESLPSLEKNILDIVTGKALVTRDLSPRETHGEESHKKYYVTMDGLCKFFCKNGETEEIVYQALQSLYKNTASISWTKCLLSCTSRLSRTLRLRFTEPARISVFRPIPRSGSSPNETGSKPFPMA